MIVIGDKHSSNTQKLFEICKGACKDTYYIQTLDDLDLNQLGSVETVGTVSYTHLARRSMGETS